MEEEERGWGHLGRDVDQVWLGWPGNISLSIFTSLDKLTQTLWDDPGCSRE